MHVYVVGFLFSVFLFLSKRITAPSQYLRAVFLYFAILQLMLFVASAADLRNDNFTLFSIFSTLRPMLLFFFVFCFLFLLRGENDNDYRIVFIIFGCVIIMSFLYSAAMQLSNSSILTAVDHFLYRRESKNVIQDFWIAFYGTTYYAAFVYYTLSLFFLSHYLLSANKRSLLLFYLSIILIYLAGSQQFYVSALISLIMLVYIYKIRYGPRYRRLLLPLLLAIGVSALFMLRGLIVSILRSGNHTARRLSRLIEDPFSVGSFQVRLEQIEVALAEGGVGGLLPVGLGRGVLLETWVAQYLYRYGLVGALLFPVVSIVLCFVFLRHLRRIEGKNGRAIALALAVWFLMLPITQLSSAMIELPKAGILSAFLLSLGLNLIHNTNDTNRFRRNKV